MEAKRGFGNRAEFALYWGGEVLSKAGAFLAIVWASFEVSFERLAAFLFLFAVFQLSIVLIDLGLRQYGIRECARTLHIPREIVVRVQIRRIWFGLILGLLIATLLPLVFETMDTWLAVGFGLALIAYGSTGDWLSLARTHYVAIGRLKASAAVCALGLLFVSSNLGFGHVDSALVAILTHQAVLAVGAASSRRLLHIVWREKARRKKALSNNKLGLAMLANGVFQSVDIFIVGSILSVEAASAYMLAARVMSGFLGVCYVVTHGYLPRFAASNSADELRLSANNAYKRVLGLSLLGICALLIILPALSLLANLSFVQRQAVDLGLLFLFLVPVDLIYAVLANLLIARQLEGAFLKALAYSIILKVALVVLLGNLLGANGVVLASTVSCAVLALVLVAQAKAAFCER